MTDLSSLSNDELMGLYKQTDPSVPRGIRNNNPLNLEATVNWTGMKGSDGRFAVFDTMDQGLQAADRNLQTYADKHGLRTVSDIIGRWAPSKENNTSAYAQRVAAGLGVDPRAPLDMANPDVRSRLIQQMAQVENGQPLAKAKPMADLSSLSDAELMALYKGSQAAPKPVPQRAPQATMAGMKALAYGPNGPDVGKDVRKSGVSGMFDTVAQMAAMANPLPDAMSKTLKQAAGWADVLGTVAHGKMPTLSQVPKWDLGSPLASTLTKAAGLDYQPKTTAGEWAKTAGQMAPAALAPGSIPQRVANVILPTLATEGSGQLARKMGATPKVEAVARFAGGVAGGAAAGIRIKAQPAGKAMNLEELKKAKGDAYQAVDNTGAAYKPEAVQTLKTGIADDMMANEMDADLHPKVAATVKMVERRLGDGDLTLSKLDKTRQLVRANIFDGGGTPEEKRLGGMLLKNIDEFVASAGPDQMAAGDGAQAAEAIAKARDLNTRYRKVEAVTDALNTADINASKSGSGGNIDNATRQQLAIILKKSNNLTPDERALLTTAVKGGKGQNMLRTVGRLSPTNGAMPQALAAGLGAATHGVGLATLPIGLAAKLAADGMTKSNIQKLIQLMAVGGETANLPRPRLPQISYAPVDQRLEPATVR